MVLAKWITLGNLEKSLKKKTMFEEAGAKKYVASNFLKFEMTNEKSVYSQIIEYKKCRHLSD